MNHFAESNLDQARKRAKGLVRAGRAVTLSEAQRQIARELGYASWPRVVHSFDVGGVAERFVQARRRTRWAGVGAARGVPRTPIATPSAVPGIRPRRNALRRERRPRALMEGKTGDVAAEWYQTVADV